MAKLKERLSFFENNKKTEELPQLARSQPTKSRQNQKKKH
jgi:hypothetical protein